MKALCTFVLSLTIFFPFHQAIGQTTKGSEPSIDQIIEQKMSESGIVGIGAAVIVDKKLVWSKGFGYADKETRKPFTTDTVMNVGSIAKNFMGVCLMKAVEEGKLSLDEDINKYLPFKVSNPYFPNERITLRNLATHTSSLADRYPFYSDYTYYYGKDAPEQLGDFLKNYFVPNGKHYSMENFLKKKPGSYRQYSNIPAALAGYIVETVTGKNLGELGRRQIFKPLKMKSTGWSLSEIVLANHTKLYEKKGDTVTAIPLYSGITYPDGGVRTSVSDLSKYFIALLNEGVYNRVRILEKESVKEMQRFQFTAPNKPENVDITKLNSGIFWATKDGAKRIGHAGTDPGVKVEMLSDLKKEVAIILFTNTGLNEKDTIKYHFGIFDELYKYGVKLRDSKQSTANKKVKEEALQLISLPDPTFKPLKFDPPTSEAVAEMGFEQLYQNTPVKFQMNDGRNLYARKFAHKSETTVILVHGVLSNGFPMNKTAGLLRETMNAEVLAVDLRGHGKPEGKPGDVDFIDQYASDLAEVVKTIRKEKPKGKIILAGHSMGGGISLRYAQNKTFPKVDGFLLFAPLLGQNTPTIPQASAVTQANEEPFLKIHIQRLIGLKMLNSIGITEHNGLNVLFFNLPTESSLKNYSYRANESMSPEDYKAGLKAVKKPLLVLVGSKDEAFVASTFETAVKENSKGKVHIIEGVTHNGIRHSPVAMKIIKEWTKKNF